MDTVSLIKMLSKPTHFVDAVIDTDAYNEVDDQYAIAYMLSYPQKINIRAFFAAPFFNHHSISASDGMEKSYDEILHLLSLAGKESMNCKVFKGSDSFLLDEKTPIVSPAVRRLIELSHEYTTENPLYVVAIGAITNIASAILLEPDIIDKIVVVWLGGHSLSWPDTKEFNMYHDIAAARIIFGSGVPLVQFPCMGVVSSFAVSEFEFRALFKGKNKLCDYLVRHTADEMIDHNNRGLPWSRVIWDVTAVSWLTGDYCESRLVSSPIPEYDGHYASDPRRHFIRYVYHIKRDDLLSDLTERLASLK